MHFQFCFIAFSLLATLVAALAHEKPSGESYLSRREVALNVTTLSGHGQCNVGRIYVLCDCKDSNCCTRLGVSSNTPQVPLCKALV
jgi:hypothetical protein